LQANRHYRLRVGDHGVLRRGEADDGDLWGGDQFKLGSGYVGQTDDDFFKGDEGEAVSR